ncbi:hypothetical protein CTI12_AA444130 [Artemisia annua]|uniref:Uncharacterized protein n=1 Tax=Artemisia annua TaxID=35608 RepID=A0A2U1LWP5_ARTAN|nr:hypothetical protein CTI12_AA444130 [Artemisia annua]
MTGQICASVACLLYKRSISYSRPTDCAFIFQNHKFVLINLILLWFNLSHWKWVDWLQVKEALSSLRMLFFTSSADYEYWFCFDQWKNAANGDSSIQRDVSGDSSIQRDIANRRVSFRTQIDKLENIVRDGSDGLTFDFLHGTFVLQYSKFHWLSRVSGDPSVELKGEAQDSSAMFENESTQPTGMHLYFASAVSAGISNIFACRIGNSPSAIITTLPVYRLATAQSVEARILKRAFSKLRLEHVVIGKCQLKQERPKTDNEVLEALKEAFEILCNNGVAGSSCAELLSTFCDLKGGSEKLSNEAIEDMLEKEMKHGYLAKIQASLVTKNLKCFLGGCNESEMISTYMLSVAKATVTLGSQCVVAQSPLNTMMG